MHDEEDDDVDDGSLARTSYVVIRDPARSAGNQPTKAHPTRDAAESEAKRLAAANRGVAFFVCIPVSRVSVPVPDPVVERFV